MEAGAEPGRQFTWGKKLAHNGLACFMLCRIDVLRLPTRRCGTKLSKCCAFGSGNSQTSAKLAYSSSGRDFFTVIVNACAAHLRHQAGFWMSDKRVVQRELAQTLTGLISACHPDCRLLFVEVKPRVCEYPHGVTQCFGVTGLFRHNAARVALTEVAATLRSKMPSIVDQMEKDMLLAAVGETFYALGLLSVGLEAPRLV